MSYIKTIPEDKAKGEVKEMYESEIATRGYLPNFAKIFCYHPKVMLAWRALIKSIIENMDKRNYELVTIAAARELRSSYCMLAHGTVLQKKFYSSAELTEIVENPHSAILEPKEFAIMEFAQKIVRDAVSITQKDIDDLKKHGFSDAEIFEITTVATARCFFSKTLDALGAEPDNLYLSLDEKLRGALVVGNPIAEV